MACSVTHAMMSHMHHAVHACRQASHPYDFMVHKKLIVYLLFMQSEGLLLKLTTSHFNALKIQIANQNMLERILIAM